MSSEFLTVFYIDSVGTIDTVPTIVSDIKQITKNKALLFILILIAIIPISFYELAENVNIEVYNVLGEKLLSW